MGSRRHVPALKVALAIGIAQAVFVAVYLHVERGRHAPRPDLSSEQLAAGAAPDARFVALDGSKLRLQELKGTPVLLHFWATWCGPCKQELPGLLELATLRPARVRVIALSVDPSWDAVRSFFGGVVPAQVVLDEVGDAARAFEVAALPDTYLIRADGTLGPRFGGARDWRSDAMRNRLLEALQQ